MRWIGRKKNQYLMESAWCQFVSRLGVTEEYKFQIEVPVSGILFPVYTEWELCCVLPSSPLFFKKHEQSRLFQWHCLFCIGGTAAEVTLTPQQVSSILRILISGEGRFVRHSSKPYASVNSGSHSSELLTSLIVLNSQCKAFKPLLSQPSVLYIYLCLRRRGKDGCKQFSENPYQRSTVILPST